MKPIVAKVAKPKAVAKVTAKKKAPNRSFTAYPKNGDAPQGTQVKQHVDYYAELAEDERLALGGWNDSAKEWLGKFQQRRG